MNNEELEIYSLKFNSLVEWEEKDNKTYIEAFRRNLIHKLHFENVHDAGSMSVSILQDYAKAWKKSGFTWKQFKSQLWGVTSVSSRAYAFNWFPSLESVFTGKPVGKQPKVKSWLRRDNKSLWMLLPAYSVYSNSDSINREKWDEYIRRKARTLKGIKPHQIRSLTYLCLPDNLMRGNADTLDLLEKLEITVDTFKSKTSYDTMFRSKVAELFPEDLSDDFEDLKDESVEEDSDLKSENIDAPVENNEQGLDIIEEALQLDRELSNIEKIAINGALDDLSEIKEDYMAIFKLMKKLGY